MIGRIVHYVLSLPGYAHRPGIIVDQPNPDNERVEITVFCSYSDLPENQLITTAFAEHDELRTPGTWHWPEGSQPTVRQLTKAEIHGQTNPQ